MTDTRHHHPDHDHHLDHETVAAVMAELRGELAHHNAEQFRDLAELLGAPTVTRPQPAGRIVTGGRYVPGNQYQPVQLIGAAPDRLRVFVTYWPLGAATNAACAIGPEESSGSLGYRLGSPKVEYLFQTNVNLWVSSANDPVGVATDDFYVSWRAEYVVA